MRFAALRAEIADSAFRLRAGPMGKWCRYDIAL
jgi:hypothetical protein